ncbi:endo-1,4-beta-glucanase [Sesbania bispinosa]|nr:endo-1,4-beta-glucanase [Sesbania bispinosa]
MSPSTVASPTLAPPHSGNTTIEVSPSFRFPLVVVSPGRRSRVVVFVHPLAIVFCSSPARRRLLAFLCCSIIPCCLIFLLHSSVV